MNGNQHSLNLLINIIFPSIEFEGFGPELHEENYKVAGMETGSRQYFSWCNAIERETVSIISRRTD